MKLLPLFFAILLLLSFSGCASTSDSSAAAPVPTATSEVESPPAPSAPLTVPGMPEVQQKQLLMDHYGDWAYTEPWESPWFYAFTDLDRNGRLEVTAACLQGSGFYTYAHVWEINSDYSGITECKLAVEEEGMSYPDIIVDSMPCYCDASSGFRYYICEDIVRGGFTEYCFSTDAVCLHDGVIDIQVLASRYEYFSEPDADPEITYYDASGNPITREEYETAEKVFSVGRDKTELSVEWIQVENPLPVDNPAE